MRSSFRNEERGWGKWLVVLVLMLVAAGAVALAVYGSSVRPVRHPVQKVLPDEEFPR